MCQDSRRVPQLTHYRRVPWSESNERRLDTLSLLLITLGSDLVVLRITPSRWEPCPLWQETMSPCRTDFPVLNILNGTRHTERNHRKHKRQSFRAAGRPEDDFLRTAPHTTLRSGSGLVLSSRRISPKDGRSPASCCHEFWCGNIQHSHGADDY